MGEYFPSGIQIALDEKEKNGEEEKHQPKTS
jgi:hypothetical protein